MENALTTTPLPEKWRNRITKRYVLFLAALLLGVWVQAGAWAEEGTGEEPVHADTHAVREQAREDAEITATDSPETHAVRRVYDLYCEDCQRVVQESVRVEEDEEPHLWTEEREEPGCETEGMTRKTCALCGLETMETLPAAGHQWETVRYTEPTCTEDGAAVRQCAVCHQEERMETPAFGHVYAWVEVTAPSLENDGVSEYRCVICGDVAQRETIPYKEILYNNTITSFGPATRDLIGGSVWNRVTPIDLSADGVYTYPLIASNRYTVGTATVTIENGIQTVSYHLTSPEVQIHSESLVIYPDLNALRTGEKAVSFPFNEPIFSADFFGDDSLVIVGITLKADYNILGEGVQYFTPDEAQIAAMTALID